MVTEKLERCSPHDLFTVLVVGWRKQSCAYLPRRAAVARLAAAVARLAAEKTIWHDAAVALKESIQRRKRDNRLDAAQKTLSGELDSLQEALSHALTEFDAMVAESLEALPEWADVDHDELRAVYHVEIESQQLTMGPRAAALVAARLEQFVAVSLPDADARPDTFEADALDEWKGHLESVHVLIEQVQTAGRERSEQARDELSTHYERLSSDLADAREAEPDSQLDDLKSRLLAGKIADAKVKRETDAEVLEGQRRRVEALQAAWEPLEQLAFAGADMSVDAAERLREVLTMAVHAVVAEYPELHEHAGEYAPKNEPIRKRKFSAPPTVIIEARDGSPANKIEIDDARRVTSPIISKEELGTAEYTREPTEEADEVQAEEAESSGEVESPVEDVSADEVVLEEPETPPSESARRAVIEETVDLSSGSLDAIIDDLPSPPALPTAPASATSTMEVSVDVEADFREPAFREVEEWQRIHFSEVLLALGPPGAYFLVMFAITAAFHLGYWSENPFIEWPWAFPSFCAFAVWALGMPGLLRWRVAWHGGRPLPIRFSSEQEESFVEIDSVSVVLDGYRFDFAATTAVLGRWEDGERGWLLAIRDDHRDALFASSASSARWNDVKAIAHPAEPEGAWRVSEETLLRIADHAMLE